jgi:hypothetical protein
VALEHRDGCTYYYRTVRSGDKVRKIYLGAGELARIVHEREIMNRTLKAAKRDRDREELEHLEALAAPVMELCEISDVLTRAAIVASGFHRHKGEWRMARER